MRGNIGEKSRALRTIVDGIFCAEPCEDRGVGLSATPVLGIHYVSLLKGGITLRCIIEVVQEWGEPRNFVRQAAAGCRAEEDKLKKEQPLPLNCRGKELHGVELTA
nr:hypothetical protein Iba_chr08cCG10380 [Ipomoea batatas]